jgi:site-specific DNA-adenine methylase
MGYLGSKAQAGVWQRIIGQMPAHSFYVEPFFGSGQIFWRKKLSVHMPPVKRGYLLDLVHQRFFSR